LNFEFKNLLNREIHELFEKEMRKLSREEREGGEENYKLFMNRTFLLQFRQFLFDCFGQLQAKLGYRILDFKNVRIAKKSSASVNAFYACPRQKKWRVTGTSKKYLVKV